MSCDDMCRIMAFHYSVHEIQGNRRMLGESRESLTGICWRNVVVFPQNPSSIVILLFDLQINLDNISAFEALSSPSSLISTFSLDPSMTFDPFGLLPPPRKTWPVAWAPNNTAVKRVMQKLARRLDLDVAGYGFATEQEMEAFVMKNYNAGMESKNAIDFLAGIVFTSNFLKEDAFPKDIHVMILQNKPIVSAFRLEIARQFERKFR